MSNVNRKAAADLIKIHRSFGNGQLCILNAFEECKNKAIESHTIPKNALNLISANGILISSQPNIMADSISKLIVNKEIGYKKASTFKGFCSHHDNIIFRDIDNPLHSSNSLNFLKHFIRSCAHELWLKAREHSTLSAVDFESLAEIQNPYEALKSGFLIGAYDLLSQFRDAILDMDNNGVNWKYIDIQFSERFPFSYISPLNFDVFNSYNAKGVAEGEIAQSMLVSVIPTEKGSRFSIAWKGATTEGMRKFLWRVKNASGNLPNFLLQFGLEHISNMFFDPIWFEDFKNEHAEDIKKLQFLNVGIDEKVEFSKINLPIVMTKPNISQALMVTNSNTGKQLFRKLRK